LAVVVEDQSEAVRSVRRLNILESNHIPQIFIYILFTLCVNSSENMTPNDMVNSEYLVVGEVNGGGTTLI
jgi:hypothetical protein